MHAVGEKTLRNSWKEVRENGKEAKAENCVLKRVDFWARLTVIIQEKKGILMIMILIPDLYYVCLWKLIAKFITAWPDILSSIGRGFCYKKNKY